MINISSLDKVPTPTGMVPMNPASFSPPQPSSISEIFPLDDFFIDGNDPSLDVLGTTVPSDDSLEIILMDPNPETLPSNTIEDDSLTIIASPRKLYRERYQCETDPNKNRAHRYIRTEDGCKYEHPTVKV